MADLILPIILIIVGMVALGFSSSKIVDLLVSISPILKIPKFLVSFLFIGLGTSFPDLLISSIGAFGGTLALAVGSLIGSDIVVLCLVLSIVVLYKGVLTIKKEQVVDNFTWIFLIALLPLVLMFDGIILVGGYVFYLVKINKAGSPEEAPASVQNQNIFLIILQLIVFLAVLLIAANVSVDNAIVVAKELNIPAIFVGLVLIALGLALPELVIDLNAIKNKEEDLVWGDLLGSFITELSMVLGVATIIGSIGMMLKAPGGFNISMLITGLPIAISEIITAYSFLFVALVILLFFSKTKNALGRAEALVLLALYVIFLTMQFDVFI